MMADFQSTLRLVWLTALAVPPASVEVIVVRPLCMTGMHADPAVKPSERARQVLSA